MVTFSSNGTKAIPVEPLILYFDNNARTDIANNRMHHNQTFFLRSWAVPACAQIDLYGSLLH
jgi:hypothetical protein